jgi:hypothetical protein
MNQSRLKELLDYDPDTGVFLWKNRASSNADKGSIAGYLNHGYRYIGIGNKRYAAHRLAWMYVTGEFPKLQIDHIDGNKDNNSISNIRDCSQSDNAKNMRLRLDNKTGIPGIRWDSIKRSWLVRTYYDGKRLSKRTTDFFEACCIRKSAELTLNYHKNHGRSI